MAALLRRLPPRACAAPSEKPRKRVARRSRPAQPPAPPRAEAAAPAHEAASPAGAALAAEPPAPASAAAAATAAAAPPAAAAGPVSASADASTSQRQQPPQFEWDRAWYPVLPVDWLEKGKPNAFKVRSALERANRALRGLEAAPCGALGANPCPPLGAHRPGPCCALRTGRPAPSVSARARPSTLARPAHSLSLTPLSPLVASTQVLGKDLCAWHDNKQWTVVEDLCPHRMAPLSLGFVTESGTLACRYHGWEFEGASGACAKVPWARDSQAEGTIKQSPSSCARLVPCEVHDGLLWVWPSDSARAEQECAAAPPATMQHRCLRGEWGMVELPVGYVPALENQFDPSHAEFLHARYTPDDRAIAASNPTQYVPMKTFRLKKDPVSGKSSGLTKEGFVIEHGGYNEDNMGVRGERTFVAPASSRTEYYRDGEPYLSAHVLYCPTEANRVKMFTKFEARAARVEAGRGAKQAQRAATARDDESQAPAYERLAAWARQTHRAALLRVATQLVSPEVAKGLTHGFSTAGYTLGDQDIAAMHGVDYAMAATGRSWREGYYLPTPADAGVGIFRRWMDAHAGGEVGWMRGHSLGGGVAAAAAAAAVDAPSEASSSKPPSGVVSLVPETQRYERYHRHTKHCKYCRAALAWLGEAQGACRALAAPSLALGALLSVAGATRLGALALAIGGGLILEAEVLEDEAHEFLNGAPRRGMPVPTLW